jgi:catechol 2,3-dioxygenase-like lactoylglutathione lyase family enzyme
MQLTLIDCPPFMIPPSYKPGDCWYAREGEGGVYFWWAEGHDRKVKPAGHAYAEVAPEHAGKRPMIVVLPTGATFCLQSPTYRDGKAGASGWTVTGELPNVTVAPSINFGDPSDAAHWHGHLIGGVLR